TYKLTPPFFVMATQNPVELEGTYPLPEAQLDRFLVKLLLPLPDDNQLKQILSRTTGTNVPEATAVIPESQILSTVEKMKILVRQVVVADPLQDVLVRMLMALTPGNPFCTELVSNYVRFGPGPRGAQAVILLSKVHALLDGRINVAFEDIKAALLPCLRHRLILHFQAEADGITGDDVINQIKNAK
ncbi:MAG: MoxR family ATPase, partial [Bdellovibrionales bacterium]|nr:MoxR family ATPase [Bdellovibrionales bacterium]